MIRVKNIFFILLMLGAIIILSMQTLAAGLCKCDSSTGMGCLASQFCDSYRIYTTTCSQDVYDSPCASCRPVKSTCDTTYLGADCCSPGLNDCVGPYVGSQGHCCATGYTWNTTTLNCQAPFVDPCKTNGNNTNNLGNNYCIANVLGKPNCCGKAGSGHCEACCSPESTNKDCGFCQMCDSSGAYGSWNCINQYYSDLKNQCTPGVTACHNGICDNTLPSPSPSCAFGTPAVDIIKDGKKYNLLMCTYGCLGNCDPRYYFCNPSSFDNPFHGAYNHCCLADATPDCEEICVMSTQQGCNDYQNQLHTEGCCDGTDICTDNHCCPISEGWTGTACGNCNANRVATYVCGNSHSGGVASCTCGGPCYTVNGGVEVNCGPMERCITYHPSSSDPDVPSSLKVCATCQASADCCVAEGGTATLPSQCCTGLWLNGTHCCQKGSFWDATGGLCLQRNPCYSGISQSGFCLFLAPNSPLPQSSWWSDQVNCDKTSSMQACCYVNSGLYGYILPSDQFYYWHESKAITVY